jgi:hypothetical protein
MDTTQATVTLYADPSEWGLAYSCHFADADRSESGAIGPAMSHVPHEDRCDADFTDQASAVLAALDEAGLVADLDDSMLRPSTINDSLEIVTVTNYRAAIAIMESL